MVVDVWTRGFYEWWNTKFTEKCSKKINLRDFGDLKKLIWNFHWKDKVSLKSFMLAPTNFLLASKWCRFSNWKFSEFVSLKMPENFKEFPTKQPPIWVIEKIQKDVRSIQPWNGSQAASFHFCTRIPTMFNFVTPLLKSISCLNSFTNFFFISLLVV